MNTNKTPIAVSVALCIAGFGLKITSKLNSISDIVGGCIIFVGLVIFSISIHDVLKTKNKNKLP